MAKENNIAKRLGIPKEKYLNDLERYLLILKPVSYNNFKKNSYFLDVALEAEKLLNSKETKLFYSDKNATREQYILEELIKVKKDLNNKINSFVKMKFLDILYPKITKKNSIKGKYNNFLNTIAGGSYTIS